MLYRAMPRADERRFGEVAGDELARQGSRDPMQACDKQRYFARVSIRMTTTKATIRAAPVSVVNTLSGGEKVRRTTAPMASVVTTAAAIFQSSPIRKSYQNRPKPRMNRMSVS